MTRRGALPWPALFSRPTSVALVALLGASLVSAQARADASAGEAAIAHGVELRRERKDAEALAEFRRAYALQPTPRALAQIALAEAALERWVAAENDLVRALAVDDPWVARQRGALDVALKEMERHLGTLDLEGTAGAEVWVDGQLAGHLPIPALRVVAKHTVVEVRAAGYAPARREIDVRPGETLRESVTLEAARALPPAAPPVSEASAAEPAPARSSTQQTLAWGTAGAAVLFLAGGVTSTIVASNAASRYDSPADCGSSPSVQCSAEASRVHTAEAFEVVAYTAAGAAAVTSAILFLAKPRAERRTGAWCAPWGTGVSCGYAF